MSDTTTERRRRARVPVHLEIVVHQEGQEIRVASRNLSLKGLACSPDERFREHACCQVVISLVPEVQVSVKGRVVRAGKNETAIDFLDMDPDSFKRLLKIVSYHAPDPETILQELLQPAFPLSRPRGIVSPIKRRKR